MSSAQHRANTHPPAFCSYTPYIHHTCTWHHIIHMLYISVPRQVRPGGCEVHIGKGRVHNQIIALDSAPSLGRISDIHESRVVHLKLVLTFSMHAVVVGHSPTSTSHPMSRDPRPSPFFATLPLPYIVLNANQKKTTNNAEAWERSYIYLWTCYYC